MNGSDSIRISLRLADGEHFPIFHYNDPDSRTLSLVPATRGQEEVDIQFFHHSPYSLSPEALGEIRFADLPPDLPDLELRLDAAIDESGMLTIVVSHPGSGRSETLEAALPEEAGRAETYRPNHRATRRGPGKPGRRTGLIMGIIFVLAGLALVFWLTLGVARWGRQDAPPPPLSLGTTVSRTV